MYPTIPRESVFVFSLISTTAATAHRLPRFHTVPVSVSSVSVSSFFLNHTGFTPVCFLSSVHSQPSSKPATSTNTYFPLPSPFHPRPSSTSSPLLCPKPSPFIFATTTTPSVPRLATARYLHRRYSTLTNTTTMASSDLPVRGDGVVVVAENLEKPDLDTRSYRVIQLPNKLEVLLVHDAETDKSSAALDVHVGNFSDADDLQGQAHAVEHLLFMGTEKYPKENEYSVYLSDHGGHSNAYTASTSTNYYFEVGHDHFEGAIDRFAQFFIAPLFLAETLDRELQAVDSENKKNLQNDTWRLHQLSKSLSNPKHPYCHFSTGNLETLKVLPAQRGVNVRDEFMKFHERYYSANTMKLVVLGRESLDQLQEWVVKYFSDIKNKDLPDPTWEESPLLEEHISTIIFAKPVMDTRHIDLVFPFLSEEQLYKSHPSRYLSHLIGHEGPGSLLAYLKKKGWVNELSAGTNPVTRGAAFFHIHIKLTEDGLAHYEEIVRTVFNYINLVKDSPIEKWIYDEMAMVAAVDFKFRQKSPPAKFTSRQAATMQRPYPREWLLSALSLLREFNKELILKAMDYIRPDNFRMMVVARDCPSGDFDKVEKWYGTEYRVEKISDTFMEKLQSTVGNGKGAGELKDILHLPHKNEFIPTKLDVQKEGTKTVKVPSLIKNTDLVRLWYKKDDTFWVPKANVYMTLRSPLAYSTCSNSAAARIYCDLVKDALNEYAYDAEIAGLEYSISASTFGLELEVSGYNDKMLVLLEKILSTMKNLDVRPDRFKIAKERLVRAWKNWNFTQPYYQVSEFIRFMNAQTMYIIDEFLPELEQVTAEDVKNLFPKLLRQTHVEALIHGNLHKEDALKYLDTVEAILKPKPLPPTQFTIRRSVQLPRGSSYVWTRPLWDPNNVNSVIEYCLYVGEQTDRRLYNILTVFSQIVQEPAFDTLRTKEQLGYIVFSGSRLYATTMAYRILVQSERTAPYLESRIEAFLLSMGSKIEEMTFEAFNTHINAVIKKKTEKLKNLNQESQRFWSHIGGEVYDFESLENDVEILADLTKDNVVEFYNTYIKPGSMTRSKASVQMNAASVPTKDRKETFIKALAPYLSTTVGISTDVEEVTKVLGAVDIEQTDAVFKAVYDFLAKEKKAGHDKLDLVQKGQAELLQLIPVKEKDFEPEDFGTVLKTNQDLVAWKAGCSFTPGARPIKPLVEFQESESKL